ALEAKERGAVREEPSEVRAVPGLREEVAERRRDLEAEAYRLEGAPIHEVDPHAAAGFLREGPARRREGLGNEQHAPDLARAERASEEIRVDPRRADSLEGDVGPAADADVRRLEKRHAGIERCRGDGAEVGRRVDPRKAGLVVPELAAIARHRDHREVDADLPF